MIIGHREYTSEVLEQRPWESPDFRRYSPADFREPNCLRCGESIERDAA